MTNPWNSFGYKPLFYKQFKELKQEVIELKQKLPAEQFKVPTDCGFIPKCNPTIEWQEKTERWIRSNDAN